MPWSVGEVVAERYRLVAPLGRGGMGAVWRAEHVTLRSEVALKQIDPDVILKSPEATARFMREAQAAAALRSTHVVQILDHGIDRGVPYIAMELLNGETLAQRLGRRGRLSAGETVDVMSQVARAVGRAHDAQIVHRDLKPDNIFLVDEGEHEVVKVLDFGIAKQVSSNGDTPSASTRTGALLGTPYYMSPEQARGLKDVDARADLWAMGVITYECLLGRRPFESDSLGDLVLKICSEPLPVPSQHGSVPEGFDAWFARAINRSPSERFQSAKLLLDALRLALPVGSGAEMDQRVSAQNPSGSLVPAESGALPVTTGALSASELSVSRSPRSRLLPLVAAVIGLIGLLAAFAIWRAVAAAPPAVASEAAASAPATVTEPGPAAAAAQTSPGPAEPAAAQPEPAAPGPDAGARDARTLRSRIETRRGRLTRDGEKAGPGTGTTPTAPLKAKGEQMFETRK